MVSLELRVRAGATGTGTTGGGGDDDDDDGYAGAAAAAPAGSKTESMPDGQMQKRELSLEEEIAMLQDGASAEEVLLGSGGGGRAATGTCSSTSTVEGRRRARKAAPFAVYDTGCKGTVIVLCTLPDCHLVTVERNGDGAGDDSNDNNNEGSGDTNGNGDDISNEETRSDANAAAVSNEDDADAKAKSKPLTSPTWDPVEVVKQIANDFVASGDSTSADHAVSSAAAKDAPSSRHLTRMIPLQATCFASQEEIIKTARSLLEKYLVPHVKDRWSKQQQQQQNVAA